MDGRQEVMRAGCCLVSNGMASSLMRKWCWRGRRPYASTDEPVLPVVTVADKLSSDIDGGGVAATPEYRYRCQSWPGLRLLVITQKALATVVALERVEPMDRRGVCCG
jgi:hypothetical protein